jgi:hypothetical protein
MEKDFTRFIGVDLGGGKGKNTALAVLERTRDGVTVTQLSPKAKEAPLYDAALVSALLSRTENTVICVDAPLTLPPCLRCTEPVCPGQDACVDAEVLTMRAFATPEPGSGRDHRRGKPWSRPTPSEPRISICAVAVFGRAKPWARPWGRWPRGQPTWCALWASASISTTT